MQMRTAIITALLTGLAVLVLALPAAQSNADFIYMCAGARLLSDGILPVTPYFPPGYPLLLWPLIQLGLSALTAGIALAALGTALCAGAVAYIARLNQVPAAVACMLGLLAASLPDVCQIAFNPHLDALYTGLAAAFIALAFRLMARESSPWAGVGLAALAALLLALRYHAVLVVIPVVLVLLCNRLPSCRRAALTTLAVAVAVLGLVYWSLWVTTGELQTASLPQIATGAAYRELGDGATEAVFDDYATWLATAPAAGFAEVSAGIKANWPQFISRRAILLGIAAWLVALIFFARLPAGSILMLLFIAGYTLAVAPTYFTPRASALPELVAMMLLGSALGVLLNRPPGTGMQKSAAGPDPAVLGAIVCALLLAGGVYNCWREARVIDQWRSERGEVLTMSAQAAALAGGERTQVLGAIDATWQATGDGLPGATYSRMWLDDPRVAPLVRELIPRYSDQEILTGTAPVAVILLYEKRHGRPGRAHELRLIEQLEQSWVWKERIADIDGVRIWVR